MDCIMGPGPRPGPATSARLLLCGSHRTRNRVETAVSAEAVNDVSTRLGAHWAQRSLVVCSLLGASQCAAAREDVLGVWSATKHCSSYTDSVAAVSLWVLCVVSVPRHPRQRAARVCLHTRRLHTRRLHAAPEIDTNACADPTSKTSLNGCASRGQFYPPTSTLTPPDDFIPGRHQPQRERSQQAEHMRPDLKGQGHGKRVRRW